MDQLPDEILDSIAQNLSYADKKDFRLCCKRCSELSCAVTYRIHLPSEASWEDLSQEVRRVCPASTVVVSLLDSQSCSELSKLLQSTLCDKVYLRRIPQAPIKKWNVKHLSDVPTKAKQSLHHFQKVHQALKTGADNNKIELACKVVASQARRYPGLHAAIASVAPNIRYLHILQSLTDFVDHNFPLSGLKTLAFTMSVRADTVVQHQ